MNEAQIIVTGNVASKPSLGATPAGVSVANMRVGYTPRRLDRETGQWVDGQTSWLTVKCWRKLADHVAMCLNKGDPVVVKGALQVRQYTDKDGNSRQAVEVLASAVGHDLNRGLTYFIRTGARSGSIPAGLLGQLAAGGFLPPGAAGAAPGDGAALTAMADGTAADGAAGNGAAGNGAAADGAAADGSGGQHTNGRTVPGFAWEPADDGAADDEDADMFDDTAIVAAALHAVPDLDDADDPGPGTNPGPSGPGAGSRAEPGTGSRSASRTAGGPGAASEAVNDPAAKGRGPSTGAPPAPAVRRPAGRRSADGKPEDGDPADRRPPERTQAERKPTARTPVEPKPAARIPAEPKAAAPHHRRGGPPAGASAGDGSAEREKDPANRPAEPSLT